MLDVNGASELLGVSTATVRNWYKAGLLDANKVGRKIYFDRGHIEAFKLKISGGEIGRLGSRANKRAKSSSRAHEELASKELIKSVVSYCESLVAVGFERIEILRGIGYKLFCCEKQILVRSLIFSDKEAAIFDALPEFGFSVDGVSHEVIALAYQHLQSDGEKAVMGAIYTPSNIASGQVAEMLDAGAKFLDPCCGAGVYLVAAIRRMKELGVVRWWEHIFGADIDPLAVVCSQINCCLEMDDSSYGRVQIVCCNSLLECGALLERFGPIDVIASNPPWGAHFSVAEKEFFEKSYPGVVSGESFSYFILLAIKLLGDKGRFSYLLPESVCFTSQHRDIRSVILKSGLVGIYDFGKLFKGLMTGVVRLDFSLGANESLVRVRRSSKEYFLDVESFSRSKDCEINYKLGPQEAKFISRIEGADCVYLKNAAIWALGIVTGNNAELLKLEPDDGLEPIYRGKDIAPYFLGSPAAYINFDKGAFQQCAAEGVLRQKGKLIYKFISSDLCFAYDASGVLTLNSANILIPKLRFDSRFVLACLNSSYANKYFKLRFNSVKVLKGHLEQIPIPNVCSDVESRVVSLVDEILRGVDVGKNIMLIDAIFDDYFKLNE